MKQEAGPRQSIKIDRKKEIRPDGAIWTHIQLPEGDEMILTSKGGEYHKQNKGTTGLFGEYRKALRTLVFREPPEVTKKTIEASLKIRELFNTVGKNSKIYTIPGTDLVIKEPTQLAPVKQSMIRLDMICTAIEKHAPRWISMPHHLLYYSHIDRSKDKPVRKEYMVMEKVNGGVNVKDVEDWNDITYENMPNLTENERGEILSLYQRMKDEVISALRKEYGNANPEEFDPSVLLTDWKPENVLIEKLKTPVAGERFRLSLIDQ